MAKRYSLKKDKEKLNFRDCDELTGLPNRSMLFKAMNAKIEAGRPFALVYVDINNFEYVNNLFGHEVGDNSLKEVSLLLSDVLKIYQVTISRLGSEFIIMFGDIEHEWQVEYIAKEIIHSFNSEHIFNSISIHLTVSIGVVLHPQHGFTPEELLKKANIALYHAREQGINTFQVYHEAMKIMLQRKIILLDGLRYAVKNNELELFYQPIYKLNGKALCGFEALIRWNTHEFGRVSPLEFIPLAEENGSIQSIGLWVLEKACQKCVEINRAVAEPCMMAINISPVQLKQKDFLYNLDRILNLTGVDKSLIQLEITESVFIENFDYVLELLEKIKDLGVKIALDDFGTGYSSLSYLNKLPIDTLKIDRSFLLDLNKNNEQESLVSSIIDIAHKLHLDVVSEGVETDEQFDIIKSYECNFAQGYLFSKPMDEGTLYHFLKALNAENRMDSFIA